MSRNIKRTAPNRPGNCANPSCDNKLTRADIANGDPYCSDECASEDLAENGASQLFDRIDDE